MFVTAGLVAIVTICGMPSRLYDAAAASVVALSPWPTTATRSGMALKRAAQVTTSREL